MLLNRVGRDQDAPDVTKVIGRLEDEKDKEGNCQAPLPTSALRYRLSEKMNGLRLTYTMNTTAHTKFIGVK